MAAWAQGVPTLLGWAGFCNYLGEMKLSYCHIAACIVLIGLVGGCGSSKPPEGDAQARFTKLMPADCMELVRFSKTDGQDVEVFGVKVYSMSYAASIRFKAECYWDGHMIAVTTAKFSADKPMLAGVKLTQPLWPKVKVVQPGEQIEFTGSMCWEKTENGWTPVSRGCGKGPA